MSDERRTTAPHDRLTRLCAAMTDALDAHPERGPDGDVRCVVMLDSTVEQRGGLQLHGYEDDAEALADVFAHLRAIFRSNGKDLWLLPLHGGPSS